MIRFIGICAVILSVVLFSCKPKAEDLTIRVKWEEGIPGIIDDVTYERDGQIIDEPEIRFDSLKKEYYRQWEHVPGGNYSVLITPVLLGSGGQQFEVSSDTTVVLKNYLAFKPVGAISLDELMKADTIEFAHITSGCFTYTVNKLILIRQNDVYNFAKVPTEQFTAEWKQIKSEDGIQLMNEIVRMENEIEQLRVQNAGKLAGSTVRQYIFIRADNAVYSYVDDGAAWNGYHDMYIP